MTFLLAILSTLLITVVSLPMEDFHNVEIQNPIRNPEFNKDLFQGDIVLTREQEESARQGLRINEYLWNTSCVPYIISPNFSPTEKRIIERAIAMWNSYFPDCITWKLRTRENNYVCFVNETGCYSNLGMIGGEQSISIGSGCFRVGTILHEMDHAIGFMHEHCRLDRDNYIDMQWENIPLDWEAQYEKTSSNLFALQGDYDYYSVMHYPTYAPGDGSKVAFRPKLSGVKTEEIGQRSDMTVMDKKKVRILYKCPSS